MILAIALGEKARKKDDESEKVSMRLLVRLPYQSQRLIGLCCSLTACGAMRKETYRCEVLGPKEGSGCVDMHVILQQQRSACG